MKLEFSKFNILIEHERNYCVINTLTSAIIDLEESEYVALKSCDLSYFSDEQIVELKKQGILIEETLDEIALLRNAYFYGKNNNQEAHITICPTLDCNFACPYCYEQRVQGEMEKNIQDNIIVFIENLLIQNVKKIYVVWYGGEPLLYPKIIERVSEKIISKCNEYAVEYSFSMISNGYLLHEDNVKLLRKIGMSRIQITLDGLGDTHNRRRYLKNGEPTFDRIVKNIYHASKFIDITVRVNVDRSNKNVFESVKRMFDGCSNIDFYCAPVTIEETQSAFVKNLCYSHEEYNEFYKENLSINDISFKSGINCCAAEMKNTYVIDPQGFLYKCLNDLGHIKWSLGNISSNEREWNISVIARYLGRDPFSEEECVDCKFLPQCFGGCIWNYKDKGTHACKSIRYILIDKIVKECLSKEE